MAELARRYAAASVLLFGSATKRDAGFGDIDLAVSGVRPRDFFRFYGDLLARLSLPVDLVDLDGGGPFVDLVRKEGVPIYGRAG